MLLSSVAREQSDTRERAGGERARKKDLQGESSIVSQDVQLTIVDYSPSSS